MIEIYLYYFNEETVSGNGEIVTQLVTGKRLIQSVPYQSASDIVIMSPTVKNDIGNAESMDFSVQPGTPYYNAFIQMRTFVRVDYDGTTIFYGRVLTVSDGYFGERKVHCEGALAFLNDSYYPAADKNEKQKVTVNAYIKLILENHNSQVNDLYRKISMGELPGNYSSAISSSQKIPNELRDFGVNSWSTSKSLLEDLKNHYGGAFRVRFSSFVDNIGQYGKGNIDLNNRIPVYNSDGTISTELSFSTNIGGKEVLLPTIINGQIVSEEEAIAYYNSTGEYLGNFDSVDDADIYAEALHKRQEWYYTGQSQEEGCYLDWFDHYYRSTINSQIVETAKNLIDISKSNEISNIFTAVIPIGKSNSGDGRIYISGYRTDLHSDNYITVPQICKSLNNNSFYTDSELESGYHTADDYKTAVDRYGLIFKVVELQEAHTQEDLLKEAAKWIKQNYQGGVDTFTVKAIDMHLVGENTDKILIGDRVKIRYPIGNSTLESHMDEKILTCTGVTYDIFNPENNQYTFGIPANMLKKTYGDNSTKSGKSSSFGGSTDKSKDTDPKNDEERWFDDVLNWLHSHMVWYRHSYPTPNVESWPGTPKSLSDGTNMRGVFWQTCQSKTEDGHLYYVVWDPEDVGQHQVVPGSSIVEYDYRKDAYGRPQGTFRVIREEELTYSLLKRYKIFDYVKQEYGISLESDLGTTIPTVMTMEDGSTAIFSGLGSDESAISQVLQIIGDAVGGDVLSVFDSLGRKVAKIQTDGGLQFAEIDPETNEPKVDDNGNIVYVDIRDIRHSTEDLKSELEEMGRSVDLLDSDVTLIGQKIGDTNYGLIKDLAELQLNVTSITGDVNLIGQYMDQSVADMTLEIAKQGATVSVLSDQVTFIGQKVDDNLSELVTDLAGMKDELGHQKVTITTITSDVDIIGQTIGDGTKGLIKELADMGTNVAALTTQVSVIGQDMDKSVGDLVADLAAQNATVTALTNQITLIGESVGDNTSGLIKDLADLGADVTALTTRVNLIGDNIGDDTRGLIKEIADAKIQIDGHDATITSITTDLNLIGNVVGDSTKGLVKDLLEAGKTITMLNNAINIINADQLTPEQEQQIRDYAEQGLTVTAIGSDVTQINSKVVNITGRLNAAEAVIENLDTTYLRTSSLNAKIGEITDRVYIGQSGNEQSGLKVNGTLDLSGVWISGLTSARAADRGIIGPTFSGLIISATVDETTNTLTLTPLSGDPITFSKAASTSTDFYLRGGWSGGEAWNNGQLLVTAYDVQTDTVIADKSFRRNLTSGNKENIDGTEYTSGKTFYIPIKTYYGPTPPTYEDTGFRVFVDATNVYNSGSNSVSLTKVTWAFTGDSAKTSNNFTYYTNGRATIAEDVNTDYISLSADSTWSSGSKNIWLLTGDTASDLRNDPITIGKISVSIPDPTSTVWINTEDYKWRTDVTVGGKVIQSAERNFASLANETWQKAVSQCDRPISTSTGSSMFMSWPNGTTPNDSPLTRTYELVVDADANYAYLTRSDTGAKMIRASTNDVYDKGWKAAGAKVAYPVSIDNSQHDADEATATISWPNPSNVGQTLTRTYAISVDNNYATLKRSDISSSIVVARADTSKVYAAGSNSVSLTKVTWAFTGDSAKTSNNFTYYTNGRATIAEDVNTDYISLSADSTWSSGSKNIWLSTGDTASDLRNDPITIGKISVSIPDPTSTVWTNTEDYKWRTDVTVGGKVIQSAERNFASLANETWQKAVSQCDRPSSTSTGSSMFMSWPNGTTPNDSPLTRTYELVVDANANYAYLTRSDTGAKMIRASTNEVYKKGWAGARTSVVGKTYIDSENSQTYVYFPTAKPVSPIKYIKTAIPNVTADGNLIERKYVLTSDDDTAYIRYNNSSGAIVAELNHNIKSNAYSALHHVTLDDNWNNDSAGHWNCLVYDSDNTLVRTLRVNNEKTSGLMFPTMAKTINVNDNNRTYTFIAKNDDNVAGYTRVDINVDVPIPTASYTIANVSRGDDCPANSVPDFFTGYDYHLINSMPASRQNYYRYIKFTVGGKKKAFYFS